MTNQIIQINETDSFVDALDQAMVPMVEKAPSFACINDTMVQVNDTAHTYRSDTGEVLGTVGSNYQIHNLREPEIVGFVQPFMSEMGATIDKVSWFGSRCFVSLSMPQELKIGGDDNIKCRVEFGTGFDGSLASSLIAGLWRMVCTNGIAVPFDKNDKDGAHLYRVRHTKHSVNRLKAAHDAARLLKGYFDRAGVVFEKMLTVKYTEPMLVDALRKLDGVKEGTDPSTRTLNRHNRIVELFNNGQGIHEDNQNTLWAAYNAMTEYLTHETTVRVAGVDTNDPSRSPLEDLARTESNLIDGAADKIRGSFFKVLSNQVQLAA